MEFKIQIALGNMRLGYDQMLTIIKEMEIEMVLNKRAITYLYTESDSIEPVTPDKLLFGGNTLYAKNKRFYAKETTWTKR